MGDPRDGGLFRESRDTLAALRGQAVPGREPREERPLIVSDPEIMSGEPVLRGARLPVARLLEYLEQGLTIDEFAEDYPGTDVEDAREVLRLLAGELPRLAQPPR